MFRFIGVMSTNEIIVKRKQTKGIAKSQSYNSNFE